MSERPTGAAVAAGFWIQTIVKNWDPPDPRDFAQSRYSGCGRSDGVKD